MDIGDSDGWIRRLRVAAMEEHTMDQSERIEDAAKSVLTKNLDAVEGSVDTVIDKAKSELHELRNEAQEVSDQALGHLERSWKDTLSQIEEYLAARPWLLFGAFCAIAFIFSQRDRQKRRAGSEYSPRYLATRLGARDVRSGN
jgi:ElaB/YqjD/DUF883 family membrane-anchored ribosome-binding protein